MTTVNLKEKLAVEWLSPERELVIASVPKDPEAAMVFKAAIPGVDEQYHFRQEVMRDLLAYMEMDDPVHLYGPTGSGKSSVVLQMAARCEIPVFRITGSASTEAADVFGMYSLQNGATKFVNGPAVMAAQMGGILLIDEADRIPPDVLVGFNGITEGLKSFVVPMTGELVTPVKGFKVIYTGNSNLSGSSIYLTAKQHDPSIPERFVSTKIDYPESEAEHAILMGELNATGFTDDQVAYLMDQEGAQLHINGIVREGSLISKSDWVSGLLQVAAMIRAQSRDGGNESSSALERTISVRSLGRWLRYTVMFCGASAKGKSALHYALRRSLTNTCTPSTAVAIHTILTTVFGVKEDLEV